MAELLEEAARTRLHTFAASLHMDVSLFPAHLLARAGRMHFVQNSRTSTMHVAE